MIHHQAKIRNIRNNQYSTPILVPSFSSKGFPSVKELHGSLKEKLIEASLISTYDLHYGYLETDKIYESDILFIDSGGYERNQEHDISDIYGALHVAKEWNETLYEKQVELLKHITDLVLVNYDNVEFYAIEEQIQRAQKNFRKFPEFLTDFLCKPISSQKGLIDVKNLIPHINLLGSFDIIGFTEKELGNSILERATSIYKIRKELTNAGLNTPIHVFGCIDPLSIILYFLCGADIFDGLSWLRFSFSTGTPTYLNHYALSSGLWNKSDNEIKIISCSDNLEILAQLKYKLLAFATFSNWNELNLGSISSHEIKQIFEKIASYINLE